MRRKVTKHGSATLSVSLPSKWAKKYGIKKGDEIELSEKDGNIIITNPQNAPPPKSKEIHLKITEPGYIRTIISTAYREGYDEIILYFEGKMPMQKIQEIVNTLYGLEVVEEAKDKCVIKSLLKEPDKPKTIINKMFQNIKLVHGYYDDYFNTNPPDISEINYVRTRQIKNRDYCQRIIHSYGFSREESSELWNLVFVLEKLAAADIYQLKFLINRKVKCTPRTVELLKSLHKTFAALHESFSKKDLKMSSECYTKLKNLMKEKYYSGHYSALVKDKSLNPEITSAYYYHIQLLFTLSSRIQGLNA